MAKTVELVEGIQKLGPRGLEAIKYPPETLHEIVTLTVNAPPGAPADERVYL